MPNIGTGRWQRHVQTVVMLLGVLFATTATRASDLEPENPSRKTNFEQRPLELGIGPAFMETYGAICHGGGDIEDCTTIAQWAGLRLAPRWRISPLFSLGLTGAFMWSLSAHSTYGGDFGPLSLGWLSAEARIHPF